MSELNPKQIEMSLELARTMGTDGKSWSEYCEALSVATATEYPETDPDVVAEAYSWFRQQAAQMSFEMMIKAKGK